MSAFALISGVLYRAAEQKVGKSGKTYTGATIRCREGDGASFWRVTAFNEAAQNELLRLRDGDHVSASGAFTPAIYQPPGADARLSLSLIADQVVALRPKPRPKPEASRNGD